jgi:hypothetical protein
MLQPCRDLWSSVTGFRMHRERGEGLPKLVAEGILLLPFSGGQHIIHHVQENGQVVAHLIVPW